VDNRPRRSTKLFISNALGMCLVLVLEAICVSNQHTCLQHRSRSLRLRIRSLLHMGLDGQRSGSTHPKFCPSKPERKVPLWLQLPTFWKFPSSLRSRRPALRNIGYKTYIIFAVLNIVNAIIVWAFYPETAGQTFGKC